MMAAEQAAGIPLLSHWGCHQIIQPSNAPGHQSHLADEASRSPSSRKKHDGSIVPISNSIKFFRNLMQFNSLEYSKKEGEHSASVRLPLGTAPLRFSFPHIDWTFRQNPDIRFHRATSRERRGFQYFQ
jgi:hypothetical protein